MRMESGQKNFETYNLSDFCVIAVQIVTFVKPEKLHRSVKLALGLSFLEGENFFHLGTFGGVLYGYKAIIK